MSFDTSLVLAYGITFGILIMTIVYTFVRYLYSKELIYICYSAMQLFSLLYIASYGGFFILPNHTQELFLAFATVGAVLFSITFYEGKFFPEIKNTQELIVHTLLLYIVLLSVFLIKSIFRIFGDDFAILSEEHLTVDSKEVNSIELFMSNALYCEHKHYHIEDTDIKSYKDLQY